jgi:hypothetical protein
MLVEYELIVFLADAKPGAEKGDAEGGHRGTDGEVCLHAMGTF